MNLQWEAAYGKAFRIEVSNDAEVWSTVHETAQGTGGTQHLTVSATGRYVRVRARTDPLSDPVRAGGGGHRALAAPVARTGPHPHQAPPTPTRK